MSDDLVKTALRVPRDLHTLIHAEAEKSGRTFNAEIVYRLNQSFVSIPMDKAAEDFNAINDQVEKALKQIHHTSILLAARMAEIEHVNRRLGSGSSAEGDEPLVLEHAAFEKVKRDLSDGPDVVLQGEDGKLIVAQVKQHPTQEAAAAAAKVAAGKKKPMVLFLLPKQEKPASKDQGKRARVLHSK